MISIAIDICKGVIDYLNNKGELRLEERMRVSSILNEISEILLDTANRLKINEYPRHNCGVLEKLSKDLHFQLIDHVKPDELDRLHEVLLEASQVEKQFTFRFDPETIPTIENASAEFKAMSILMKF